MIPVDQTITTPPLGNCYAACIASIFEVPLSEVPQITEAEGSGAEGAFQGYEERLNAEFFRPRNVQSLLIRADEGFIPAGFSILSAQSPRGPWEHAVVCLDGAIVHDPHPERHMGVGEWRTWIVFSCLNPGRLVYRASGDSSWLIRCSICKASVDPDVAAFRLQLASEPCLWLCRRCARNYE